MENETYNYNQAAGLEGGEPAPQGRGKERGLLGAIVIVMIVAVLAFLFFARSANEKQDGWTAEDAARKQTLVNSISERTTVELSADEVKQKDALLKTISERTTVELSPAEVRQKEALLQSIERK